MPGIGDYQQSSFGHDGWDPPEDYGELPKETRGGGLPGGPYRFRIPDPDDNPIERGKPARKRVIIVSFPFYMWEHSTYKMPNVPRGVFTAICPRQNKISDVCALCDDRRWPSFGAYFTVIDMGFVRYTPQGGALLFPEPWVDREGKKRESQFRRQLMVAKRGGKDNPGQMTYFEEQRHRRGGDLTGCVFDALRSGGKKATIGDQWEFVERIGLGGTVPTEAELRAYLLANGASPEVADWKYEHHDGRVETLFTRFTTHDVQSLLHSNEEMARWLGQAPAAAGDGQRPAGRPAQPYGRTEGAGYAPAGGAPDYGDVPPPEEDDFRPAYQSRNRG